MAEVSVRRAVPSDVAAVQQLVGGDEMLMRRRFGQYSLAHEIDACHMSIVALGIDDNLLGFASFHTYPTQTQLNVPASSWEAFLQKEYDRLYEPSATLWMNFFYADASADAAVLETVLRSVFTTLPDIDDILLSLPSSVQLYAPLNETFKVIPSKSTGASCSLFACQRVSLVPDLEVRLGFVEDHDDLLQLVEHQGEALAGIYGDYYLAELLERQDKDNRTLVAEVQGEAVGILRVSAVDFDPRVLAQCFELDPYDNLMRKSNDGSLSSACNAFRVQLFTVAEDWESRCIDFLAPAFDLFPDKDYCIMTVPYTASSLEFLRVFTPVPPRLSNTYSQALFVFHRASLIRNIRVQSLSSFAHAGETESKISRMLEGVSSKQQVIADIADAKRAGNVFVISSAGEIVGVATLRNDIDAKQVRDSFDVDALLSFAVHPEEEHTVLGTFILNPIFLRRVPFLLMELLRLNHCSVMYYRVTPEIFPSVACEWMVPVAPRRVIETLDQVRADLEQSPEPSIMYITRSRLLSEPLTVNNSRIVVVGASDTGLSVIYNLLMVPDVKFRNITLISPHGLPPSPKLHRGNFRPVTHTFMPAEYSRMLLDGHLRIIENRLVDFYRDRKMVVLADDTQVPYDYLILATGQQYKLSRKVHPKEQAIPEGVFVIRDQDGVMDLVDFVNDSWLPVRDEHAMDPILVYGSSLDAYCTVTALIAMGVQPQDIVLATPRINVHSAYQVGEFADAIEALLLRTGVQYMKNNMLKSLISTGPENEEELSAVILQFDDEEEKDEITKAMEGARDLPDPVEVACSLLVYVHSSEVDDDILHAVNYRALVFDGRLILKPTFKTEDPCVMAVGSVAKFSRRFGPSEPFELFNPREVATKFTNLFFHDVAPDDFELPSDANVFPPVFSKPLAMSCVLPNDRYLFRAWSPSYSMLPDNRKLGEKHVSTNANGNYIGMWMDPMGRIQEVQYLGVDPALEHNLLSLIGMPATYMHNLVSRFEEGILPDIYSFLQENWSFLLFHDRFAQLRERLFGQFVSQADVLAIEEKMRTVLDERAIDSAYLADSEWKQMFSMLSTETKAVVERMCIEFMTDNKEVFHMYHIPALPVETAEE